MREGLRPLSSLILSCSPHVCKMRTVEIVQLVTNAIQVIGTAVILWQLVMLRKEAKDK